MSYASRWFAISVLGTALLLGLLLTTAQIRLALVLVFAVIFTALSFRVSTAIVVFFAVMPFLGIARRLLLFYEGPVRLDPILLLPDLMIAAIFLRVLIQDHEKIIAAIKSSWVLRIFTLFGLYLLLQCFNPAQGGLLIGLNGIKFYILPMLWAYVGLTRPESEFKTVLKIIAVMGLIAALYGLWQYYAGFSFFDKKWISSTEFASLGMFGNIRTFSIFNAPEEYSRFVQVALLAMMAFFPQQWAFLGILAVGLIFTALYQSGVRSSLVGAMFSLLSVPVWRKSLASTRFKLYGALLVFIVLIYTVLPTLKGFQNFYAQQDVNLNTHVAGALNPLQQTTVKVRFEIWKRVLHYAFFEKPFGVGTGALTPAGLKFSNAASEFFSGNYESYFFGVLFATGLIGLVLLALWWGLLFLELIKKWHMPDRAALFGICIFWGLVLNSIFGNVPMIYAIAPIYYYLMGHLLRQVNS